MSTKSRSGDHHDDGGGNAPRDERAAGDDAAMASGGGLQGPDVPGGVMGDDASLSPEEKKRKGAALRRAYAVPHGPMASRDGAPTAVARRAQAYGEPVPKNDAEARALADKGERLLREAKQERTGSDTARPAASTDAAGKPAAGGSNTARGGPRDR